MDTTMHYFDTELAEKYGMVEATILNHLQYWIQNYHEGRYWTFHSIQAFCKQFPYLTAKKIRNAIKKLENAKVLIKGNFNKVKYDRTTWYALTDLGLRLFSKKEEKPELKVEVEKPAEQDNAIPKKKAQRKIQCKYHQKQKMYKHIVQNAIAVSMYNVLWRTIQRMAGILAKEK